MKALSCLIGPSSPAYVLKTFTLKGRQDRRLFLYYNGTKGILYNITVCKLIYANNNDTRLLIWVIWTCWYTLHILVSVLRYDNYMLFLFIHYELQPDKTCMACAPREDSILPAHTYSSEQNISCSPEKPRIVGYRLRGCNGSSETSLGAYIQLYIFHHSSQNNNRTLTLIHLQEIFTHYMLSPHSNL